MKTPFILGLILVLLACSVSAAYDYKISINCSNTDTGTPIVINGTNGFNIGGGKQIVWTNCQPEASGIALHYDSGNNSNYAVKNNTDNLPFEMESGNGISYNPTDVWDNFYTLVVHFNNMTAWDFMGSTKTGYNLTHTAFINYSKSAGIIGDSILLGTNVQNVCLKCVYPGCYHYPSQAIGYTLEMWVKPTVDFYSGQYLYDDQPGTILKIVSGNILSTWIYSSGAWFQADSSGVIGGGTANKITSTITNNYVTTIINTTAFYSATSMGSDINFDDAYGGASFFSNIVCDPHNTQPPGYADEIRFSNKSRGSKYTNDTFFNVLGVAGYGVLGVKTAYCSPSWSCSAYGNCSISNTTACLNVSDSNLCGETFGGDLGDYNGTCSYCWPNWYCSAYASCASNNISSCLVISDYSTCNSTAPSNQTAYNINCSYTPPPPHISADNENLVLLAIGVFFWVAMLTLTFIFRSVALTSMMWLSGIVLGFFFAVNFYILVGFGFMLLSTFIFLWVASQHK